MDAWEMEGDAAADGPDTVRAAALAFIGTDSDRAIPMPDDGDEEASGEAKRQFGSTPRTAWLEWEAFCKRVETGDAAPSCVIDFAYTDNGRLRGGDTQLERCICFHDPVAGDPDEIVVAVHVHTTEKWVNRKRLSTGRRLDRITSVNARHAHKDDVTFKQEAEKKQIVPSGALHNWRELPENEIVWFPGGAPPVPPVPRKDAKFKRRYELVGKVIKAGEEFCQRGDLANTYKEMESLIRGGVEVERECEVVACIDRGKVRSWGGLRVAGLCIGVDDYTHTSPLCNAVRDAQAVNAALRKVPGCNSSVLCNPKTAAVLLESVQRHAEEKGLQDHPPEMYKVFYAGHGIQIGQDVYLVPTDAQVDNPKFIPRECVSLKDLLETLREALDEPVIRKYGQRRAIHFLISVDSCRVSVQAARDRLPVQDAMACEPTPSSCPHKWTVIFSCSRTKPANDGPSGGHSPFAKAFLDGQNGVFAGGLTLKAAISKVSAALSASVSSDQRMVQIGDPNAIPEDFCMTPCKPKQAEPMMQPAAPAVEAAKGPTMHDELMDLLRQWKLGDEKTIACLSEQGVSSLDDLQELEEEDVQALMLPLVHAKRLRKVLQHLAAAERVDAERAGAEGVDAERAGAEDPPVAPPTPSTPSTARETEMEHELLERKNLHEGPFPSASSSHHFHMVSGVDVEAEPISEAAASDSGNDEHAAEGRLMEMGFTDSARNALLLQEFNGDMDKVIEKLTMEALPPPPAPVAAQADEALAQEMAAALQSDSDAELAAKVQEQLKVEAVVLSTPPNVSLHGIFMQTNVRSLTNHRSPWIRRKSERAMRCVCLRNKPPKYSNARSCRLYIASR